MLLKALTSELMLATPVLVQGRICLHLITKVFQCDYKICKYTVSLYLSTLLSFLLLGSTSMAFD